MKMNNIIYHIFLIFILSLISLTCDTRQPTTTDDGDNYNLINSLILTSSVSEINVQNLLTDYTADVRASAIDENGIAIGDIEIYFEKLSGPGYLSSGNAETSDTSQATTVYHVVPADPNFNFSNYSQIRGYLKNKPEISDTISLTFADNVPDCNDCEAGLTILVVPDSLPQYNQDYSIIYAQITDSLGTGEIGEWVSFDNFIDSSGVNVNFGQIDPPFSQTDSNGIATSTFQMTTKTGYGKLFASWNQYSDTTIVVITSSDAVSLEIIPPMPNVIMIQGGGEDEETDITVQIKDGNGNLVTSAYVVALQVAQPSPQGVFLYTQDDTLNVGTMVSVVSVNGEATATIHSGSEPGSVKIIAELYNLDENINTTEPIASAEEIPVTIVTGPPAMGEINFSYVDITPVGGGIYEIPIGTLLYDMHGNPVADSTNIYYTIRELASPWNQNIQYDPAERVWWASDTITNANSIDSLTYQCSNRLSQYIVVDECEQAAGICSDGINNDNFTACIDAGATWLPTYTWILGECFDLCPIGSSPSDESIWEIYPHPAEIIGSGWTGMSGMNGNSYPGLAWTYLYYGSSNVFDNVVIFGQTYDGLGNNFIVDSRDSHEGAPLIIPFRPGIATVSASTMYWDFSIMGAPDSDPITITGTLIDYYEYPIEGGRLQISALGAQGIPDTCLDENGEIIEAIETEDDCVAIGGTWSFINPKLTDNTGTVSWLVQYNENLCPPNGNESPITYSDFTSNVSITLLDPQMTSSEVIDILLKKTQID